jgi:hypothetical protein
LGGGKEGKICTIIKQSQSWVWSSGQRGSPVDHQLRNGQMGPGHHRKVTGGWEVALDSCHKMLWVNPILPGFQGVCKFAQNKDRHKREARRPILFTASSQHGDPSKESGF